MKGFGGMSAALAVLMSLAVARPSFAQNPYWSDTDQPEIYVVTWNSNGGDYDVVQFYVGTPASGCTIVSGGGFGIYECATSNGHELDQANLYYSFYGAPTSHTWYPDSGDSDYDYDGWSQWSSAASSVLQQGASGGYAYALEINVKDSGGTVHHTWFYSSYWQPYSANSQGTAWVYNGNPAIFSGPW